MAYQKFDNLGGPNDVLTKMRDFAIAQGWTVLENLTPDLSIDEKGTEDGLRLSIQKGSVYANFRSANGKPIFESRGNITNAYGIGLVCSTNYSATPPSGKWYDQPGATKHFSQQVIGVGIPVKKTANYRLYCNAITDPAPFLLFSLELEPGVFQHLAVGDTQKVGAWTGGTIYSGSRNSYYMFTAGVNTSTIENESNRLFSMSKKASTFLRIDVDAAPLRIPSVLWASSGPDDKGSIGAGYTGKTLGLSVVQLDTLTEPWFPKIPHYGYLQSQDSKDTGRNVNTLNCISVNLPMAMYVQRDPDALRNYSQVGYIPGVYCISMRNVSPGQTYEISYPLSGNMHQTFPHTRRAGAFGYDGFSIKQ